MPVGTRNSIIEGFGIHHIAIQTRDWDASLQLYRDILGMQVVLEFGERDQLITLLDVGDGSHIELFPPNPDPKDVGDLRESEPVIHFAFSANDVRKTVEHIRQAGYEITSEPNTVDLKGTQVTYAFFKGPNGELLELFQTHN